MYARFRDGLKMAKKKAGAKAEKEREIPIPSNRTEAAEFVGKVRILKNRIAAVIAEAEAKIAAIQKMAADATDAPKEEVRDLVEGLFVFFETNSPELTEDGARRSVDLLTGVIGERLSPWKVELKGVEEVLEELHRMGLTKFIRPKEEVNKDAMLSSETDRNLAATVKGVSVVREDTFFVKPTELGEDVTRLRKITIGKEKVKK